MKRAVMLFALCAIGLLACGRNQVFAAGNGTIQYWVDGNANGVFGEGVDLVLNQATTTNNTYNYTLTGGSGQAQPNYALLLKSMFWVVPNPRGHVDGPLGSPIIGATVKLVIDSDNDGLIEPASDTFHGTATTESSGNYGFSGNTTGTYRAIGLVISLPSQYICNGCAHPNPAGHISD